MILDIAIIAWATVLSLWPRGTWAVVGQPPSQPSTELLGTGAPEAAPLLPVSFMSAPNSFRNPDRGINSVFVCKSVVLGRDEQPLGLT